MNHRHRWRIICRTGRGKTTTVDLGCKCKERINRLATLKEVAEFKRQDELSKKFLTGTHTIWHNFAKKFFKFKEIPIPKKYHKAFGKTNNVRDGWKFQGYKLMCAVEKWAEKYPDDVFITSIDDDCFMGARMVFIVSRSPYSIMGVNVVILTQQSKTIEFFLYPDHIQSRWRRKTTGVLPILQGLHKLATKLELAEKRFRKKHKVSW